MTSINKRLEKLKEEAYDLRKGVTDLKKTLEQQNEIMVHILKTQSYLYAQDVCTSDVELGVGRIFPLRTIEDLENFNDKINEENKDFNIAMLRNILQPLGLIKNLTRVISLDIIMVINMDGYYNKKRLLDFTQFIDVMFNACYKENYTRKQFISDFRCALRLVKSRVHKSNCVARRKQQSSLEIDEESLE